MIYSGGITIVIHAGFLMIQTGEPRRTCEACEPHDVERARRTFERAYWTVKDKM